VTPKIAKRFDNRTVIVTGVPWNGRRPRPRLRRRGANVVIADVLEQEGRTLADELAIKQFLPPRRYERRGLGGDGSRRRGRLRPVSVLVNNAPSCASERSRRPSRGLRQVIDINLTGTYLGIRAVVPSMRKAGAGAIVNMSAAAG